MRSEPKSDDELAQRLEETLESEHQLRLIWMEATGLTYEDAVAAFNEAKAKSVQDLVHAAKVSRILMDGAAQCTCEPFRFPEKRRDYLKGTRGPHHSAECVQWSDLRS